jgi:hypothetical protein
MRWLGGLAFSAVLVATAALADAIPKGLDVKVGNDSSGFVSAPLSSLGRFSFPVLPLGFYQFEIVIVGATPASAIGNFHLVLRDHGALVSETIQPAARARQTGKTLLTLKVISDGESAITGSLISVP